MLNKQNNKKISNGIKNMNFINQNDNAEETLAQYMPNNTQKPRHKYFPSS